MRPKALCLIRHDLPYRREAFCAGLEAVGFVVSRHVAAATDNVLVIWNRYGSNDQLATSYERAGAAVIVAENGYIGHSETDHAKPLDLDGNQLYALALSQHNGAGDWWIGELGRWREQGIEVRPWRHDGEHILVLPQRGIGPPSVAMPAAWPEDAVRRLQATTDRPVRVRAHPGNAPAVVPLARDLDGCWAAVTWGSGAGIKAICAGVPVLSDFPRWIGRLASTNVEWVESPARGDLARERMLERLAWAQWSIREIRSGEPFKRLMAAHAARQVAA